MATTRGKQRRKTTTRKRIPRSMSDEEIERLVQAVTEKTMGELKTMQRSLERSLSSQEGSRGTRNSHYNGTSSPSAFLPDADPRAVGKMRYVRMTLDKLIPEVSDRKVKNTLVEIQTLLTRRTNSGFYSDAVDQIHQLGNRR